MRVVTTKSVFDNKGVKYKPGLRLKVTTVIGEYEKFYQASHRLLDCYFVLKQEEFVEISSKKIINKNEITI